MDIYKLNTGSCPVKKINVQNFEADTNKQSPYYINEKTQYAVCPRCDNPIQIIGLYTNLKNTDKPYGKHGKKDILNVAVYNQEAYDCCPLANPQRPAPAARKLSAEGVPNTLLILMQEEFDRIVYILRKETGISFSKNLLSSMLTTFRDSNGYLYRWGSISNLPWIFAHMSFSKSLYAQKIKQDSELWKAIKKEAINADFDEDNRLIKKIDAGWMPEISFCFLHHIFSRTGENEQIIFRVTQDAKDKRPENALIIFQKTLDIDQEYFINLINLPEGRSRRETRLLDLAHDFWNQ